LQLELIDICQYKKTLTSKINDLSQVVQIMGKEKMLKTKHLSITLEI